MPSSIEPGCDLSVSTWNISKWACPNQPAIERTCVRAVDHAKFKTTKIYSQSILVNYMKLAPMKISRYTVYSCNRVHQYTNCGFHRNTKQMYIHYQTMVAISTVLVLP